MIFTLNNKFHLVKSHVYIMPSRRGKSHRYYSTDLIKLKVTSHKSVSGWIHVGIGLKKVLES